MSNTDVIIEVLLKFTEPYLAIGETNHDERAYNNLLKICYIHDYCYDLIRENAELKGNEYSIVKAREKAIRHLSESIDCMKDLLDDLGLSERLVDVTDYESVTRVLKTPVDYAAAERKLVFLREKGMDFLDENLQ